MNSGAALQVRSYVNRGYWLTTDATERASERRNADLERRSSL